MSLLFFVFANKKINLHPELIRNRDFFKISPKHFNCKAGFLLKKAAMLVFCGFVGACAPEPSAPSAPPNPSEPAVSTAVSKPPLPPTLEETEEEAVVETFYDPSGLRDPFEPFIKVEEPKVQNKKIVEKRFIPVTPLQRFSASELKLVGVVWAGEGKAKALIQDPQGKGYVVTGGTLVGDQGGKISRIKPDRVMIEEPFDDPFGEKSVRLVTMTLRKSEDEVGP